MLPGAINALYTILAINISVRLWAMRQRGSMIQSIYDSLYTRSSAVAEIPCDALSCEIRIRGRSRSLEIVPISRADTSSY